MTVRRRLATATAVVLAAVLVPQVATSAAEPVPVPVASQDETTPVGHSGDAADDPAIWVNGSDPAGSLVLGNDKKGALESYDLDGNLVQRVTNGTTRWGNVDVRGDLVAAVNGGIRVFRVNPATRQMSPATDGRGVIPTFGEGLCMYQSATATYVFTVVRFSGRVRQYQLSDTDNDGLLEGRLVRDLTLGTEAEGCAVDDVNGALYVSEEDVALWRLGAEPASGAAKVAVDTVVASAGQLQPDIEGVTVAGDYVIASAQNLAAPDSSYFATYDRQTNAFVGSFRVVDGAGSDDCDRTDGVAAYAGDLGPAYPNGLFVCQDHTNSVPGSTGRQNFKLVPWQAIPTS